MTSLKSEILGVVERVARGELSSDLAAEAIATLVARQTALTDKAQAVLSDHNTAIADALRGLVGAVTEFRGVAGRSAAETEALLKTARRKFAIQLSAALIDAPGDTGADGDTSASLELSSSLRVLRQRFNELGRTVTELVEATIRDSQYRKELEIAGTVQQMLVPGPGQRRAPGLIVSAWYEPAEQCGGDWWTLVPLGVHGAMVMIGDVTGHGAPAAIVTGTVKGALEMALLGLRDALSPQMLLNLLNQVLVDSLRGEYMMSGIATRYNADSRMFTIANAGHHPVFLARRSGLQSIAGDRSPPLGATRAQKYTEQGLLVQSGDVLIMYTDGVIDCMSPAGQPFGERRLRGVCEEICHQGGEVICNTIRREVESHRRGAPLRDDLTLLAVAVQ